jgi:heme o synthase
MSLRPGEAVRAYATLTKPRIILLLLVTTVPAMVLARGGVPSVWLILATLAGGTVAAGGANAINQYLDRDIDELMSRTRGRPLPRHTIEPTRALTFGIALAVVSFGFLALSVNLLAAALSASAVAFYVFVYTAWLKRRSPQNIVIGGAAGAVPVLVGWAAVTGTVAWPAVVLFAVVFLWTPPHFWALSLRYRGDYEAAGVPMLPVVAGWDRTVRDILGYTFVLAAATLVLVPVAHMGWIYLVAAVVLGAAFVAAASRLRREATAAAAMAVFRFSIVYLALLFLAVAVDTVARFRL